MFTTQEQFSSAAKANFEAQIAAATALTTKAFNNFAQIVELNVNTAKASIEQSTAAAQQLLAVKDVQEFFTLSASQTQPNAEKALAYGRSLAGIASAAQAEFAQATEAQFADVSRKVNALVDEIAKNAPAGSENAVAMLKTAIANASAGVEQLSKNGKQAAESLEENLTKVVKQFTQTTEKAAGRAKK
jgi:phasin family protein